MPSSTRIQIFESIAQYRQWRHSLASTDDRALVGFVPTMGALHAGHAALIRRARSECSHVVVSVFVNPLQFGPNEDYDRYPRAFEGDVRLCREAGADVILHPSVSEVYPRPLSDTTLVVPPKQLVERLCGLFRPGHFEGVATVVTKLFGMVEPTFAYFGEKDYQQLTIIRRLVADLNVPLQVIGVPTVREADGLAMSSRNVYLSEEQRRLAPALHKAISGVLDSSLSGKMAAQQAVAHAKNELQSIPGLTLQYLEACDADTLEPLQHARKPMVVLVAAKLGDVRLIDNVSSR